MPRLQLLQLACLVLLRRLLLLLGLLLPHLVVSVALGVPQLLRVDLAQLVLLGLPLRLPLGLQLHMVHLHQPPEALALRPSEHQLHLQVSLVPLPRDRHQVVACLAAQRLHLEDFSGLALRLRQRLELQLLPQAVYLVVSLQHLRVQVCLVPLRPHLLEVRGSQSQYSLVSCIILIIIFHSSCSRCIWRLRLTCSRSDRWSLWQSSTGTKWRTFWYSGSGRNLWSACT